MEKYSRTTIILIAAMAIYLASCVEPYEFSRTNYEKVLVVDGSVTNLEGPYEVKLSYTSRLEGEIGIPVVNADVKVLDDAGNTYQYSESEEGSYLSSPELKGEVGTSYKLLLSIAGRDFETGFTMLREPQVMDSIHGIVSERLLANSQKVEKGIQFFVNTSMESSSPGYYRYEWEDTYSINTPYGSGYIFNFIDSTVVLRDVLIGRCYSSASSTALLTATSAESALNRVENFPVRFISQLDQSLRSKYSILVKQYSLSPEAYGFYRQIIKNSQSGGSLIDQQLGTISGNVKSMNDPNEIVLGYFEVSGASEIRSFFYPADFDGFRAPRFQYECNENDVLNVTPDSLSYMLNTNRDLLIFSITLSGDFRLASNKCSNCSWYANTDKPDFWND
ncbi:MAG: hypothetical protein ACJA0X_000193 [Cyclobacteriaceae bacterium]|jgi:hypothetical protein